MNISFANVFNINLENIPINLKDHLYEEIGEHIKEEKSESADMNINFVNNIDDANAVFLSLQASKKEKDEIIFYDKNNKKFLIKCYSTKAEILVEKDYNEDYFFDILEHLYMQKITEQDLCFLHCSSFMYKNKIYNFPACNNTGKTKLMLDMIKNDSAKYLGDDWVIIDDKGNVYPYFRTIRFYINDYIYNKDILKTKIPFDFLIGNYFERKKETILKKIYLKIVQKVYLPIKVGREILEKGDLDLDNTFFSKCDKSFFYTRVNSEKIEVENISTSLITKKMISAILNENTKKPDFENWVEFLENSKFDHKEIYIKRLDFILKGFFESTSKKWLKIPLTIKPEDIKNYLMKEEF